MSNKMWEALIEHAKTCVLSTKLYVYYPKDNRNVGVVFNNIYELRGLISGDRYQSADSLSDGQKVYVDTLVKKAYDNRSQVVEYDGKSLVNFKQTKRSGVSRNDYSMGSIDYQRSSNNQLLPPCHPVVGPSEPASIDSNLPLGGYNDNLDNLYQTGPQLVNTSAHGQYDINFISNGRHVGNSQQIQNNGYDNRSMLALGPPLSSPSSSSSFQPVNTSVQQQPNMNPFDEWSHNSRD